MFELVIVNSLKDLDIFLYLRLGSEIKLITYQTKIFHIALTGQVKFASDLKVILTKHPL